MFTEGNFDFFRTVFPNCAAFCSGVKTYTRQSQDKGLVTFSQNTINWHKQWAGLALKLPEKRCADLIAAGAGALKYFAKSPIKKGYVVLPVALAGDRSALLALLKESLAFIRS